MRAWLSVRVCWEGDNSVFTEQGREVPEAHGYGVKAPELLVKGS